MAECAFHGIAGEIVRLIEPHTEADPAALLIQTLAAAGNVFGRYAHSVADSARHGLNINGVLIGVTAKGRKGTSWANVARVFQSVDEAWASSRVLSGLSSGEGLIWSVRDEVVKRVPVKVKGRFAGEYDTVIEHEGITDKRLLVLESEFANVLRVMQRDGNTLSPVIRLAWDTGTLQSMVKNSPAKATGAHVSIIGHITKDELRRYLDRTEAANGLGNRFLWLCVKRSKCLPEGGKIHTVDFAPVARRLKSIVLFAASVGTLTRDDEARALWGRVYPELSEGKSGMAGALLGRAEAQVMRLASIYAVLDQSAKVQAPHLKAALELWRYCEQSVRFVFGSSLGDPLADELAALLKARQPEGLRRTDINKHFGGHRDSAQIGRALTMLAEQGRAVRVDEETEGRPAERWFYLSPSAEEAEKAEEAPGGTPFSA